MCLPLGGSGLGSGETREGGRERGVCKDVNIGVNKTLNVKIN